MTYAWHSDTEHWRDWGIGVSCGAVGPTVPKLYWQVTEDFQILHSAITEMTACLHVFALHGLQTRERIYIHVQTLCKPLMNTIYIVGLSKVMYEGGYYHTKTQPKHTYKSVHVFSTGHAQVSDNSITHRVLH